MFRKMRREKQSLSKDKIIEILNSNTSGVLGVNGDNGYPYTVPLSYVYKDDKLFFHCAKEGHKFDSIINNDKVTFCIIDKDEVIQEKFDSLYRSVIMFGRARILTDEKEKQYALEAILDKYSPDFINEGLEYIKDQWNRVYIVEIHIEHMTGKAAKDILNV
ncbi:MAG: pyridoxamine 5'-phosphate oxidase family protein [Tissierellaceae bacterium]|nr:pyridoxamine 5'-phosphate oxidase family protein [Tissierellaceae bacterium]